MTAASGRNFTCICATGFTGWLTSKHLHYAYQSIALCVHTEPIVGGGSFHASHTRSSSEAVVPIQTDSFETLKQDLGTRNFFFFLVSKIKIFNGNTSANCRNQFKMHFPAFRIIFRTFKFIQKSFDLLKFLF